MSRAEELRAEADRIEAEELKAERLKTADTIPTCPECGGRSFKVYTFTIVSQSIEYDDDGGDDWSDDYESGDHTTDNQDAECNECGANVRRMLERHGWQFYADPEPADALDIVDPEPKEDAAPPEAQDQDEPGDRAVFDDGPQDTRDL